MAVVAAAFMVCCGAVMVSSLPHLNPQHGSPVIPTPTQWPKEEAGRRAECRCGETNPTSRIVGGQEVTPPHKYPWMAGMLTTNTPFKCGGSIINEWYIMTAAHCYMYHRSNESVALGDHGMMSFVDDTTGITRAIRVQNVTVHEGFTMRDIDNDIALLKLAEPLDFTNPEIRPVCLPKDDSLTYEGILGYVTGWGFTTVGKIDNTQADILKEMTAPILDPKCLSRYNVTENMICILSDRGMTGPCHGDSGGPLTVIQNGRHVQVGIVSHGMNCGSLYYPTVFARVSKFIKWISDNTEGSEPCYV